jgi:hypothetical protein
MLHVPSSFAAVVGLPAKKYTQQRVQSCRARGRQLASKLLKSDDRPPLSAAVALERGQGTTPHNTISGNEKRAVPPEATLLKSRDSAVDHLADKSRKRRK